MRSESSSPYDLISAATPEEVMSNNQHAATSSTGHGIDMSDVKVEPDLVEPSACIMEKYEGTSSDQLMTSTDLISAAAPEEVISENQHIAATSSTTTEMGSDMDAKPSGDRIENYDEILDALNNMGNVGNAKKLIPALLASGIIKGEKDIPLPDRNNTVASLVDGKSPLELEDCGDIIEVTIPIWLPWGR